MIAVIVAGTTALLVLGSVAANAVASAKAGKLPDPCVLVTAPDVQAEYAKLGPDLTPTMVQPTKKSPTSTTGCETDVNIPGPAVSTVLVEANPPNKLFPCPPKPYKGTKKIKVSGVKALVEPVPGKATEVRDITFPKKHACLFVEIFLSGGNATVPQMAYVDFAKLMLSRL